MPGVDWRAITRWTQRLGRRGFPFMVLRSRRTAMGHVRAAARAAMFAHLPLWQRWPLRSVMTLLWPVGALLETRRCLFQAPADGRVHGKWQTVRQGFQMWWLAMLHNVPPLEFSSYNLARKSHRALAADYFYWCENDLLRALNTRRRANIDDVQDKARFAEICRLHGLPCIPTLAVFRRGMREGEYPQLPADEPRLWIKDLAGKQGSGTQQWQLDNGVYQDSAGRSLTPARLAQHLLQRDCIVQPWLSTHPALAAPANGPLVVVRVVTGILPSGDVHRVACMLSMPNGRHRPILCAIDDDTCQVSRILSVDGSAAHSHPVSGHTFVGMRVPHWHACIELACNAHRLGFQRFAFLGWDVAITADGPLLVETNAGWGAMHHQMIEDKPLGDTPFATIAMAHLESPPCA
ncbi:Sugar-transfer associated ATP-grasp [Pseudomonas asturiensis]|uniref:Sugar-transfer associated ATP-grasp n=2 Tax=Pseudomonas asturiensis TaxID=1190415 RepID=A0A1M7JTR7_9PSED|nr:Sugar-transfer associated ATP-grasp [Pseudomonas asturiensis]